MVCFGYFFLSEGLWFQCNCFHSCCCDQDEVCSGLLKLLVPVMVFWRMIIKTSPVNSWSLLIAVSYCFEESWLWKNSDCASGLENIWSMFIFKYSCFQAVLGKTKDVGCVQVHWDVPCLFLTEGWWGPSLSLGPTLLLLPWLDHPFACSEEFPGIFRPDFTR